MSKWMDLSNSANKFKQSYIQGFVDISGGLYIRNDYAVNLYNKTDLTTAKFSIKSDQMRIYDGVNTYYDVSNAKLIYIKDLSENVQTRLTDLNRRTKYINSDISDSNTMMTLDNNNRKIVTYTDIVPSSGNAYNLGSEEYPFGSVFVNDGTVHFVNNSLKKTSASLSYNNSTGLLDLSANGKQASSVLSYGGNVGIGKSTPTAALDVSGNTLLSGAVHVTATDLSENQFKVDLKTFFYGNVDICGNLHAKFPNNSIPSTAIIGGVNTGTGGIYIVNDTDHVTYDDDDFALIKEELNMTREFDITVTGNLVVTGDSSMNGNLYAKTPSYNNNSSLVATTAFVQNQGYATPDNTLFRQFV